jgi:predicted DNA-binding transcriptional regulator YafY
MSYGVDIEESIEGRRKYFKIKKLSSKDITLSLTADELNTLFMCKAFTEHLLGRDMFEDATRALEKSLMLYPKDKKAPTTHHFGSFKPGSINYTPFREVIRNLIAAMDKTKVCKVTYKKIMAKRAKSFYVQPIMIFSHHDTLYLHAKKARRPGEKYVEPKFDPLLAIHRIKKVEVTDRSYKMPKDFDFEKTFNKNFGIIRDDAFEVEVEFNGYAAEYVSEKIWSPDQKITKMGKEKILLKFTASSEPELIGWVLSWGDEAKVMKPTRIANQIKKTIKSLSNNYG